jgi:hypothetical protein
VLTAVGALSLLLFVSTAGNWFVMRTVSAEAIEADDYLSMLTGLGALSLLLIVSTGASDWLVLLTVSKEVVDADA